MFFGRGVIHVVCFSVSCKFRPCWAWLAEAYPDIYSVVPDIYSVSLTFTRCRPQVADNIFIDRDCIPCLNLDTAG